MLSINSTCFCSSGQQTVAVNGQCPETCLDATAIGLIVGGIILAVMLVLVVTGLLVSWHKDRSKSLRKLVEQNKQNLDINQIMEEIFGPPIPETQQIATSREHADRSLHPIWNATASEKSKSFPKRTNYAIGSVIYSIEEEKPQTDAVADQVEPQKPL